MFNMKVTCFVIIPIRVTCGIKLAFDALLILLCESKKNSKGSLGLQHWISYIRMAGMALLVILGLFILGLGHIASE